MIALLLLCAAPIPNRAQRLRGMAEHYGLAEGRRLHKAGRGIRQIILNFGSFAGTAVAVAFF
jgi:hypothetical protein